MSKQFIALKDGLVAGPCSLDQGLSLDSQMGDEGVTTLWYTS